MRTLEIIIAIILLIRIMVPLIWRESWIEWISVVTLGVMGLHLLVEGYRWQMIPLNGIAYGFGIFSIWQLTHLKTRNRSHSKGSYIRTIGWVQQSPPRDISPACS